MKRRIQIAAALCLLVIVVVLLLGLATKSTEKEWTTYTVRPGDKLWDIAEELEVQNWDKWRYETCQVNNIQQGGLIFPGQELVVYVSSQK